MSIQLQKEQINLSRVVCERTAQTITECDVIVPDTKPDVLKILRISSDAVLTEKTVQTDKISLCGDLRIDILYIPDGNVIGKVKSISTTHSFTQVVEAKGVLPGMTVSAEVEWDQPEHSLLNSRKLNIRNKLGFSIKVSTASEVSIATGVDGDEPIRTNCENLKICNTRCEAERDIVICERLDVPAGKPDLGEILKFCVKPTSEELRFLDNKAIIKGELHMSTLYCSNDEESAIHCMEHSAAFTEIPEIGGLSENMSGEIDYSVKNVSCEIGRDSDGDKRVLCVEVTLTACIRATELIECTAINDAYGLNHRIITDTTSYNLERLIDSASASISEKERVSVPEYLPEINQIFDCTAVPSIENVTAENNLATVSGYLNCNILYTGSDSESPISGFSHVIPFRHTFNIAGITEASVCDAKADIEHMSYAIADGRNIDIRPNITLHLKAVNPETCEFISDIEIDEKSVLPRIPSMIVYFIQPGDTLWSIAKRYRTTPDALADTNNVDPDNLKIGSPLYIFR